MSGSPTHNAPTTAPSAPALAPDPAPAAAAAASAPTPEGQPARTFWDHLRWLGAKAIEGAEYVGEGVASVLGLDDSRFQYVLDSMDEQDWAAAKRVDEQRKAEERTEQENREMMLAEEGVSAAVQIERVPAAVLAVEAPAPAVPRPAEGADLAQINVEMAPATVLAPATPEQ